MRRIGIVVALEEELEPFLNLMRGRCSIFCGQYGYKVLSFALGPSKIIYLIWSGYGEIAATLCAQFLIDRFNVDAIINYGVAGSLSDEHRVGDIGFVKQIIHYDFGVLTANGYEVKAYPGQNGPFLAPSWDAIPNLANRGLREFVCASADKFVEGETAKRELNRKYGADICEMEAAGIVTVCNRNDIRCSFIKAISDGVCDGTEAFERNTHRAATKCARLVLELIS